MLYKPLIHDGRSLGVLVVGWYDVSDLNDPRAVTASVLGHEGAAVIARADVIDHLTDEAHTDAPTHLPNRRAWDSRLGLALAESKPLAIVMLDLDHFKRFNDTYGHPAGDDLLRTAGLRFRVRRHAPRGSHSASRERPRRRWSSAPTRRSTKPRRAVVTERS